MKIKEGVNLTGLRPEMSIALMVVESVYYDIVGQGVTVTSAVDGKHRNNSRHYIGLAVDIRTRDDDKCEQWSQEIKQQIAKVLRQNLGSNYDVVVESTHIHIEYDPK